MRTAIDTNIVSALWSREPLADVIEEALGEAKQQGAVLVCGAVYAELLAHPKASGAFVDDFLAYTGIRVDFRLEEDCWRDAGRRYAEYAERRREVRREGSHRRLLADFVIGAHALLQADRLMTLDSTEFRRYFPELQLLTPAD